MSTPVNAKTKSTSSAINTVVTNSLQDSDDNANGDEKEKTENLKHANNDNSVAKLTINRNDHDASNLADDQKGIQNNVDKQQNQEASLAMTNNTTTKKLISIKIMKHAHKTHQHL